MILQRNVLPVRAHDKLLFELLNGGKFIVAFEKKIVCKIKKGNGNGDGTIHLSQRFDGMWLEGRFIARKMHILNHLEADWLILFQISFALERNSLTFSVMPCCV